MVHDSEKPFLPPRRDVNNILRSLDDALHGLPPSGGKELKEKLEGVFLAESSPIALSEPCADIDHCIDYCMIRSKIEEYFPSIEAAGIWLLPCLEGNTLILRVGTS